MNDIKATRTNDNFFIAQKWPYYGKQEVKMKTMFNKRMTQRVNVRRGLANTQQAAVEVWAAVEYMTIFESNVNSTSQRAMTATVDTWCAENGACGLRVRCWL